MNEGYAIYAYSPSLNMKVREFLLENQNGVMVITDAFQAQQRANSLANQYIGQAYHGAIDWLGQIQWETWGIETLDVYASHTRQV